MMDMCCSGGRERLAFSVLWEMDKDANIVDTSFHKTIIKSSAALTYQEAQSLIDDNRDQSVHRSFIGESHLNP